MLIDWRRRWLRAIYNVCLFENASSNTAAAAKAGAASAEGVASAPAPAAAAAAAAAASAAAAAGREDPRGTFLYYVCTTLVLREQI